MLSSHWQPMADVNRLRNELDRLFGQVSGGNGNSRRGTFPLMNLWEDDNSLYLEAELPGFEMDDLEIYVTGGNQLSISGERKQPEHEAGAWHRQERGFGKFRRTLELPGDVDSEKVSANFRNGVLTLTMPKSEAAKPRRIEVKAD
ncbi:heat shock protein, HSP20 [Rhodopirellula maiorica SM1]|uniref:Heat shock protein, HSP20 n=1 Tax=Rhodopirellula maiorica SM1 TaxID=1265738 RepID=M5RCU3_9BACT|nr:Hsp20/alpha crystallin family protein [Rhodopirellula maiorica]EMI17283.1 heat shock protein, HSP20 [Rhodopirellula maiorica SM1]